MYNYIAPKTLLKGRGLTSLKIAIDNKEFKKTENTAVLGKADNGKPHYIDLYNSWGILIKSDNLYKKKACLHSIILSMLFKYSPEDLRFIFIDTKGNELKCYEGLPHSLSPVLISDYGQALSALHWAIAEGERRYSLFKGMKDNGIVVYNIEKYNAVAGVQKLPRIVIVLNDLEDVLKRAANAFLNALIRILQRLKFAGIHIIMSIVTTHKIIVKNYFLQNIDIKILYRSTDEEILFMSSVSGETEQMRSLFIDEQDISTVVNFIKNNNATHFCDEFIERIKDTKALKDYDYHKKLAKLCLGNRYISIPLIQSNLLVDYEKAKELFGWLESTYYISSEGEVTIPLSELYDIYGDFENEDE